MDLTRTDGHPEGHATVYFDPTARKNFHYDREGERVYHEVPEGHTFNAQGELVAEAPPETTTNG